VCRGGEVGATGSLSPLNLIRRLGGRYAAYGDDGQHDDGERQRENILQPTSWTIRGTVIDHAAREAPRQGLVYSSALEITQYR